MKRAFFPVLICLAVASAGRAESPSPSPEADPPNTDATRVEKTPVKEDAVVPVPGRKKRKKGKIGAEPMKDFVPAPIRN